MPTLRDMLLGPPLTKREEGRDPTLEQEDCYLEAVAGLWRHRPSAQTRRPWPGARSRLVVFALLHAWIMGHRAATLGSSSQPTRRRRRAARVTSRASGAVPRRPFCVPTNEGGGNIGG